MVSAYRSHDRHSYLDVQEFVEDSLYDYIDDNLAFDTALQDSILPVDFQRQLSTAAIDYARDLLTLLRIELPVSFLDIPYLYTCSNTRFAALIFDNSVEYLAVFLTRGADQHAPSSG